MFIDSRVNPDNNVIKGFRKMSKQRIYDRAVKHIDTTRVKSFKINQCVYSGTGCNAAPLLVEEFREKADHYGAWSELVTIGVVPATNEAFISDLQTAHDRSQNDSSFMRYWLRNMRELAEKYKLNTTALDKVAISVGSC